MGKKKMVKINCTFKGDVNWFIAQLTELGAENINKEKKK